MCIRDSRAPSERTRAFAAPNRDLHEPQARASQLVGARVPVQNVSRIVLGELREHREPRGLPEPVGRHPARHRDPLLEPAAPVVPVFFVGVLVRRRVHTFRYSRAGHQQVEHPQALEAVGVLQRADLGFQQIPDLGRGFRRKVPPRLLRQAGHHGDVHGGGDRAVVCVDLAGEVLRENLIERTPLDAQRQSVAVRLQNTRRHSAPARLRADVAGARVQRVQGDGRAPVQVLGRELRPT